MGDGLDSVEGVKELPLQVTINGEIMDDGLDSVEVVRCPYCGDWMDADSVERFAPAGACYHEVLIQDY
jgi:hypothetical protein